MNATLLTPHDWEGTGIRRYGRRIATELQTAGVDIQHPVRREIEIFGRRVGGIVSRWVWSFLGRVTGDVVHAIHHMEYHRSVNVATIHDLDPWANPHDYEFVDRLQRWRLGDPADLDAVITPSRHVREGIIDHFDVHPDKVHAVHHGVDDQVWYPDHDPGIPQADIDILTVGDIRPRKQTHRVVDALRRMRGHSIHWHHVGPHCPSGYERTVRARCQRLEREGRLTDHGWVTDEELRQLYSSVDVLVYPSRDEGFGFPPTEAAACGTPSVCTPLPVFRETLGHRFEQLSSRWPDSEDFATAILHAAGDTYDAKKLRETVRPYTWERAGQQTLDVYQGVMP